MYMSRIDRSVVLGFEQKAAVFKCELYMSPIGHSVVLRFKQKAAILSVYINSHLKRKND